MILKEGEILSGRYRILSLVGQGGMSYVYRAEDRKMGRLVALKLLKEEYCEDREFIRKFQREAQAAASLNHPNIVSAYDVVDDEEHRIHYIVMELVEGITLKQYIKKKGRLSDRETIRIALQLIDGMEQAHRLGIVHRDIKPQNMMVSSAGTVKIADFGIARAASQQTVNATVMGSVHYISPEQARSGAADERSDIYSFGCTLYEMLTGRVPYDGETSVAVVFSHMEDPIPRVSSIVPDVSPALDRAVFTCMQKKPSLRYQHISELGEDLRAALSDPEGKRAEMDAEREEKGKRGGVERGFSELSRGIAFAVMLLIAVLLLFIGSRIFRFIKAGRELRGGETTTSQESSTKSPESSLNITISALETRLPDIIGKTIPEATEYMREYQLKFREGEKEYSDSYREGVIISYPDGSYRAGDSITVIVSAGPETIYFYDAQHPEDLTKLHKMRFSEVQKELNARKIPFTKKEEFSETVAEGCLISSSKASTAGSGELILTVSRGSERAPISVPDLVGSREEDAVRNLKSAGFQLGEISYEEDPDTPTGVVIEQNPEAGDILERGGKIDLKLSGAESAESTEGTGSSQKAQSVHWYGSLNQTLRIGSGGPGVSDTMMVTVYLRQDINGESRYTTLQSARSYTLGTELQLVFSKIRGADGVSSGIVEVVDAEKDSVLAQYNVSFRPESGT